MLKQSSKDTGRKDTDEIIDLIHAYEASSALCAALELGLFWQLEQEVLSGQSIAELLKLPETRCQYWLQYLCKLGLVKKLPEGFSLTEKAQTAILESFSQETWALLAEGSREQFPVFQFFTTHFREPGSLWETVGYDPPSYVDQLRESPGRARRFTRMLYELHLPLAEEISKQLDMKDVHRLMDLGGGSGVVSMALLNRHPQLRALVVDIPNVCVAGRELAAENLPEDRLTFLPMDFLHDKLPAGFDMVMECDVGIYSDELFAKIREAINPGGRFVVIDLFAPEKGVAPPSRISWALQGSLQDPDFQFLTLDEFIPMLEKSGFHVVDSYKLTGFHSKSTQYIDDMFVIDTHV
jgi:SAM-dependent methyltransferase